MDYVRDLTDFSEKKNQTRYRLGLKIRFLYFEIN